MRIKKTFTLFMTTLLILSGWVFFSPGAQAKTGMFVQETGDYNPLESVPDQIIVKYKKLRTTAAARKAIAARYNMRMKKHISLADLHIYKLKSPGDRSRILRELNQNPAVLYAEPDYILYLDAVPDDSSFTQLWGLNNTGQTGGTADADIDAPEAWDVATGSHDVIVAVIDSGVDYNHVDLAANMWTNPGEIPGDGIDNDGNNYIDDVYGINAITSSGDPMDDHSHGTHCSGTIGGVGNNGTGVAGVSWKVKIMALKCFNSSGRGTSSNAITCIQYAIDKGAHIMSNSYGGFGYSQAFYDVIEAARQQDMLFVVSAGNNSSDNDANPHYPSDFTNENIISVAATDHNDNLAGFSNYGLTSIDVAAPGVNVYSTMPGNGYGTYSGTSMACPHAAGLAALIKAQNPAYTYSEIKNRILGTVELKPALQGKTLTGGRINAYYAVMNDLRPLLSIAAPLENTFVSGTVPVRADASDNEGIAKVEFYIDDELKFTASTSPYQFDWDSTTVPDGKQTVKAIAYDTGSRTRAEEIAVYVNNSGLPGITILNPSNGGIVRGKIDINALAFYEPGLTKVEFYMDGGLIGEKTEAPYTFNWDTVPVANGNHTISAKAYGSDSSVGTCAVDVTVENIIIPESERNALIALYNSTNGDNWHNNTNWKKQDGSFNDVGTEFMWYGVSVADNHVVNISFNINNLTGTLPPQLGNLTRLKVLSLPNSSISGVIPGEIRNLANLEYLSLAGNWLSGSIPPEIGNLTNLKELNLASNKLSGTLPAELGNLVNLGRLSVGYNRFTGTIPPELGNCTLLTWLNMKNNQFSGSIPAELGNLKSLNHLSLTQNQLTGSIPGEIWGLTRLTSFYVDYNHLSGPLSPGIGNLSQLRYIRLNHNALSGEIPSTITNLTYLVPGTLYSPNIGYNAFYSNYGPVRQFLAQKDPDWESTQTSPPTDVSAVADSYTSLTLYWMPIAFTDYTGGYRIYSSTTSGGPYTLIHSTADKTVGSYTVDGLSPGTRYYFVIKCHTDANEQNATAVTSGYSPEASVTTPTVDSITLTSPNGGETLTGCSYFPITWTSEGNVGDVAIEYSTFGADSSYISIVTSAPNTGSYVWKVPDANTSWCYVRIYACNGSASDTSDAALTIVPCPGITVTSPNGGETIINGTAVNITWDYVNLTGNVTIELIKGDSTVQVLGTTDVSARTFAWDISRPIMAGNDYRIKISNDTLEDGSDSAFAVVNRQSGADFNKDGKPDLLWRHYQNGKNVIWFMDHEARAGYQYINSSTDLNWKIDATGDFNSDGNTDIVWRNYSDGRTAVWYMNGTTKTGSGWFPTTADTNWKIVGTGDFNSDGHTDIVWRYDVNGDGRNCIWYMNGVTKTGHAYFNSAANTAWRIVSVNDFNNDGKPDILWRYYAQEGYNVVWFMDNATKTGHAYLNPSTNLDWKIEGSADFNGNGHTDIVWRNYRTGQNVIWHMLGTVKYGHSYFTSVTDLNWNIENN